MNQGHGDPPADVRAFLPRPGEPVQQYAERLRGLHRDLTLVLEAVERGLATAGRIEEDQPAPEPGAGEEPPRWRRSEDGPRAEEEPRAGTPGDVEIRADLPDEPADPWEEGPVEIHPVVPEAPAEASDDVARTRSPRPAVPRIEVLPAPSGERRRADAEDRRAPEEEPAAPVAEAAREPEPEPAPMPAPVESPRGSRFPPRPSAATTTAPEPEWVERDDTPRVPVHRTTSAAPPPAAVSPRYATQLSPVVLGGLVAGWAAAIALLLALLLG